MAENYQDSDGNPVSLERLVRMEPDWAASRIRANRARIAELEAQVAEARTRIAYAAESSTVTTSDNPGCFWCDHEEHTEKCLVPGWLARTAPKEPDLIPVAHNPHGNPVYLDRQGRVQAAPKDAT